MVLHREKILFEFDKSFLVQIVKLIKVTVYQVNLWKWKDQRVIQIIKILYRKELLKYTI